MGFPVTVTGGTDANGNGNMGPMYLPKVIHTCLIPVNFRYNWRTLTHFGILL